VSKSGSQLDSSFIHFLMQITSSQIHKKCKMVLCVSLTCHFLHYYKKLSDNIDAIRYINSCQNREINLTPPSFTSQYKPHQARFIRGVKWYPMLVLHDIIYTTTRNWVIIFMQSDMSKVVQIGTSNSDSGAMSWNSGKIWNQDLGSRPYNTISATKNKYFDHGRKPVFKF
jgi:hypothetical protein